MSSVLINKSLCPPFGKTLETLSSETFQVLGAGDAHLFSFPSQSKVLSVVQGDDVGLGILEPAIAGQAGAVRVRW